MRGGEWSKATEVEDDRPSICETTGTAGSKPSYTILYPSN